MRSRILAALTLLVIPTQAAPPSWMHVTIEGRSAENSTYLEASFFYQLQTLVGTEASSPKVLDSAIVRRQRKELYINLDTLSPAKAGLLRNITGKASPVNITLGEYRRLYGPALLRTNASISEFTGAARGASLSRQPELAHDSRRQRHLSSPPGLGTFKKIGSPTR